RTECFVFRPACKFAFRQDFGLQDHCDREGGFAKCCRAEHADHIIQSRLFPESSSRKNTLPIGTAFHERTLPLCQSLNYREWSGYYTVSVYEVHHEHEYNAIRNAAALIDISPLYKYLITGKDATKLVNRIITRDINKVAKGQVIYCCWCDEQGKVIDD